MTGDGYIAMSPKPVDTNEQRSCNSKASGPSSTTAAPALEISSQMALEVLKLDEKHAADMKKIILAILSFGIFVAAMFLHIPTTSMYQQHYGVFSALATSGSETITDHSPVKFYNIETIPDVFDWLNNTFIPEVFDTTDYNGATLPTDQWGRIATFNKVLGAVHFEATYMEPGDCEMPSSLTDMYTTCFNAKSTTKNDIFISFAMNTSVATTLLTTTKEGGKWLNSSTSQLLITVITLNAQVSGYAVTKLHLDFKDGGYIKPSASTTATLLDQYPSTTPIVLDVLTLLWFSPWVLISTIIFKRKAYEKQDHPVEKWLPFVKREIGILAFPDGWSAMDFLRGPSVYLFYITVFITQAVMMNSEFRRNLASIGEGGPIDDEVNEKLKSITKSFGLIASLTVLLRILATVAIFALGLRILNTFRDHVGLSILTRTMGSAVKTFGTFFVIFAIVFVAFAAAGTALFGDRVQEFSSLLKAMKTCMNMIYGEFDFESIKNIDYSVAYYWAYMTMETFVLLNIVLAIVIDAYQKQKKKTDKNKCWMFWRVTKNVFRQWLASVNDLVRTPFCCRDNGRHNVVFWGRIRSVELQDKIDTMGRKSEVLFCTAETLHEWFPDATEEECEATMEHIAVEQKHQSTHDLLDSSTNLNGSHGSPSLLSPARSYIASPAHKLSHQLSEDEFVRLDMEKMMSRMDSLQQTLDILVQQMTK